MFESEYTAFLQKHTCARTGESLRRLQVGHSHAERKFLEQVWWPAFGSFDFLHPEYAVYDFKGVTRFIDFAYIRFPVRVGIEIDGYGSHCRDLSRSQFADQLMRQNHLIIDGWQILRFSYDDVVDKPKIVQQLIHQFLGKWFSETTMDAVLSLKEQLIIQFMISKQREVTPVEVAKHLGISSRHARTLLQRLVLAKLLLPASGGKRIRSYRLNPDAKQLSRI